MKKITVADIGTINLNTFEVTEGVLEMRMPVEVTSEQMEDTLDGLFADFNERHPNVENPTYEIRLVFNFGYDNPEFTMMVIVFDVNNHNVAEFYEEISVHLSEKARKHFRKAAWEKLGEALFGI